MDLSETTSPFPRECGRHYWELARADFLLRLLKKHLPPGAGTLLDVGCGDGYLLQRLTAAFPARSFIAADTALDPARIAALEAIAPGRLRVIRELPPELPADLTAVMLFDLLEHIEDDGGFLRSLHARVPSGTLFFITVPAGSRLYGEHDRKLRHFRRYDRKEFHKRLEICGLNVLEMRSFFSVLYPIRWLELLCGRKAGGEVGTGALSPRFLNAALRALLYTEARLEVIPAKLGLRLPGLSLEAVCRK